MHSQLSASKFRIWSFVQWSWRNGIQPGFSVRGVNMISYERFVFCGFMTELENEESYSRRTAHCVPFPILNNWFLPRYALVDASLWSQVSPALPPDVSSLKRTPRMHWTPERQQHKCHFFLLLQREQREWLRAPRREAQSEAFPESKWRDTVGRFVAPLSRSLFSLSTHQSVGGGGAPIHRSTQQLHTQHHIMPGLPTRKLCDSYSLRRSNQTGSPPKQGNSPFS